MGEDEFKKFGKIRDIDFHKDKGFSFIEYYNYNDARDAVDDMHGRRMDGNRVVVEFKGDDKKRNRDRRGPDTKDVCYNCGRKGHWANECREGDWRNRCYRCGKGGHLKRDCSLSRTPSSRR